MKLNNNNNNNNNNNDNHEIRTLGDVPVSEPSRFFHLLFRRPMFLLHFSLYFSACMGILFVSILSKCCSHFRSYCCICRTMFSLRDRFLSLCITVIPKNCRLNFIWAASCLFSSLFFSIHTSLPNFEAALAIVSLIVNFVF